MKARPDVGPLMIQIVVATVSKVHDKADVTAEIDALLKYVEYTLVM